MGAQLEGGIDDQGEHYVVLMPAREFARLIELLEELPATREVLSISVGGQPEIQFRLGMMKDHQITFGEDGTVSITLTKESTLRLVERLSPLSDETNATSRVHLDVIADHTRPKVSSVVFERLAQ